MLPAFIRVGLYKLTWEQIQVQLPCSAQEGHRRATSFTDSAKAVPGNSYQSGLHQIGVAVDVCVRVCEWAELFPPLRIADPEDVETAVPQRGYVCVCNSVGPETENMHVFTFSVCFYTKCSSSYTNVTCCSYDLIRKADRCLGLHQCVHTIKAVCVVMVEAKWQKWCNCSNT